MFWKKISRWLRDLVTPYKHVSQEDQRAQTKEWWDAHYREEREAREAFWRNANKADSYDIGPRLPPPRR